MAPAKIVLITLATLALGAAGIGAVVVWAGLYNVAANAPHTQMVYSVLEIAMHQSVRWRARHVVPPSLDDEALVRRGAGCFSAHCVQCHGAPGVAQDDAGKSMQPVPGPLVDAHQRWQTRELYWLTRNGIKMSGMPAWEFHLGEADLWAVVAFLDRLPALTPRQYAELTRAEVQPDRRWDKANAAPQPARRSAACGPASSATEATAAAPAADAPADVRRGQRAIYQYACYACHTIPGIVGDKPNVGPPLAGIGRRTLIAGQLSNTPENMVRWLRETHEVDPNSAMPEMGLSARDARDIAGFLATLK